VVNFYKIPNEDIIVIYDDISLEVGRLRIREKGSHGGHNGIKSIIANLSSDVFPRVKIGVGGPKGDLVSHVLGKFSNSEIEVLRESIIATSEAVVTILSRDTKEAMNKFNGFKASAISD
ncbi:peptidyl-tRNA hydrolase, partial [Clostridium saudiense]|nr:peptidyl-tRNA hydrolase [Clostridium saudiense]